MRCPECGGSGWVLDCNPTRSPVSLELLPCLLPDCIASGREVASISVNYAKLTKAHLHPAEGYVMSLAR